MILKHHKRISQTNRAGPGAVWAGDIFSRSFQAIWGRVRFCLKSYRNGLRRCRLCHCVQLAKKYRLICLLAFSRSPLDQKHTRPKATCVVKFWPFDFLGSTNTCSMRLHGRNRVAFQLLLQRSSFKSCSWEAVWLFEGVDLPLEVNIWHES